MGTQHNRTRELLDGVTAVTTLAALKKKKSALPPFVLAATLLVACDDRPTGPGNEATDDAALRSASTNSPFGPMVLPATGTLADGGSFVGEVEIRRIDVDHTTGIFTISGMLHGKATPAGGNRRSEADLRRQRCQRVSGRAEWAESSPAGHQCDVLNLDSDRCISICLAVSSIWPRWSRITAVPEPATCSTSCARS